MYLGCPTSEEVEVEVEVEVDSDFFDFNPLRGGTFRVELTGFDSLRSNCTKYSPPRDIIIAVSGSILTIEAREASDPVNSADSYGAVHD